jgi:hypothetical protein
MMVKPKTGVFAHHFPSHRVYQAGVQESDAFDQGG